MLIVSRRLGGAVTIGDNIVVTVTAIDRGKIRLGIQAPREIGIWREELLPLRPAAAEEGTADAAD